jgi:hypothetical protein
MNKRIQKLAKQIYGTCATEQEIQFAQLILQECIHACHEKGKSFAHRSAGEYQSDLFTAAIKRHFGIGEPERRKSDRRKGYEHPAEGTTRALREVKNRRARQPVDSTHRICEHGRDAYADDCGMCDAAGTNWARAEPKRGRKK